MLLTDVPVSTAARKVLDKLPDRARRARMHPILGDKKRCIRNLTSHEEGLENNLHRNLRALGLLGRYLDPIEETAAQQWQEARQRFESAGRPWEWGAFKEGFNQGIKVLVSKPGGGEQPAHHDRGSRDGEYNGKGYGEAPLSMLYSLDQPTKLIIRGHSYDLPPHSLLIFRSDVLHAGAAYDEYNTRIHAYLDVKPWVTGHDYRSEYLHS